MSFLIRKSERKTKSITQSREDASAPVVETTETERRELSLRKPLRFLCVSAPLRAGFFFLLLLAMNACQKNEPAIPREKARELANVFYNRDLYKQAVAEYGRLSVNAQANQVQSC
jgi:hypothetical protein